MVQVKQQALTGEQLEELASLVVAYNTALVAEHRAQLEKELAGDAVKILLTSTGVREVEVVNNSVKLHPWFRRSISLEQVEKELPRVFAEIVAHQLIKETSGLTLRIQPLRAV